MSFSILSLNVCTDQISTISSRNGLASVYVRDLNPDLIVLQEAASSIGRAPFMKDDRYHPMLSSGHRPTIDLIQALPAVVLGALLLLLRVNAWWLLIPLFFFPPVLLFIVESVLQCYQRCAHRSPECVVDWMGLSLMASKRRWSHSELLSVHPFPAAIRGYARPAWGEPLAAWLRWWISNWLLRPGFMLLSLKERDSGRDVLVVSCHLATGVENSVRTAQVEAIHSAIQSHQTKRGGGGAAHRGLGNLTNQPVIIVGDLNADEFLPEIELLRSKGFVDACRACYPVGAPALSSTLSASSDATREAFVTWHDANPLVPPGEPNQRLDYIFFSKHSFEAKSYRRVFDAVGGMPIVSDHYGILAELEFSN